MRWIWHPRIIQLYYPRIYGTCTSKKNCIARRRLLVFSLRSQTQKVRVLWALVNSSRAHAVYAAILFALSDRVTRNAKPACRFTRSANGVTVLSASDRSDQGTTRSVDFAPIRVPLAGETRSLGEQKHLMNGCEVSVALFCATEAAQKALHA